ncbi:MAG TPA: ATP-binding protein [Solimonas sp.]|nr:ATP-binding protein [Solimonas sp.]
MSPETSPGPSDPGQADESHAQRFAGLRGEARLRTAIDDLANQLCPSVDGNFDFSVRSAVEDETLEKLTMLLNFVLDTARRGMSALREHNEALARLDQAKTIFFSNASHELRTPLTLMLGPMEDALASPQAALGGEALAMAHRNAVRLHKLVNSLLDFSRIEAGRMKAAFVPTDLARLTRDLAGVYRAAVERAGLSLTVECPPLPEPVFVDREMWETIVLNLLSNAFKFTFTGGIAVSLRADQGEVELVVRDTGVGVPQAELPRLFERFHRVEGTRSRTHEGFGIGLAMIHELVRLHGGSVQPRSTLGQGTSFSVRIPLGSAHLPAQQVAAPGAAAPGSQRNVSAHAGEIESWLPAPEPAGAAGPAEPRAAGASAERARILLADDNADMRTYVARLLGEHWEVVSCSDGQAALEAALDSPPDLVLADVMMPRLDGYGLLKALRGDARTRTVPIMLLSARAGGEAVVEGLETGADDYLVKPFSARELLARVRTHLELSRLRLDNSVVKRVGALLNARMDLQGVVQILTEEATHVSGAEFGAFFYNVTNASGESYMLYTLAGVPREAFEKFPMPRNTALFAPTFGGQGVVRIDDVMRDPRYGHSAPYHGMPAGHLPVRAYLAVPVVSRTGEVLGGLFLGHSRPGVFNERSERLVSAVAIQATIAIDNAKLYESAQVARAQAEAATQAKNEFLAMLGHELRNPLAPIVNAVDLMALRGEQATHREREVIRRQVSHLVRLVDDLLDVSRITHGKFELLRAPVELSRIVAKALEISGPLIEQRRHRLTVAVPDRGLVIDADPVRMAQVVSNLLGNAAKYTEPGGSIVVTAGRDGAEVVLRVRDSGMGIGPDLLPRIFDLYEQGQHSPTRSLGGLGLGLAIVRSLVTLHGGRVEAHSQGPGQGSEFVLRLPAFAQIGAADAAEPELARRAQPGEGARRVLVVDDNVDGAQLLAASLSLLGHDVRVAGDGASALLAAAEFQPQVVLLDIALPGMDGYEVARRLRRVHPGAGMRLVALTGYAQHADRVRSAEAGFDEHLAKPVSLATLETLLRP